MKIITRTKRYGILCYVQVKDILFLARITNNKALMQQYLNLINNGKNDDEFVKITQNSFIDIFAKCDYIINFNDFNKSDTTISYLSRLIVNINFCVPSSEIIQECIKYKTEGIGDIMSFKKGELNYTLPLVPDGILEYKSLDGKFLLESTVIPDTFTIRAVNGSEVKNNDYYEFYLNSLDKIFNLLYPELEKKDRKFTCVDKGKILIINVNSKTKKKTGGLNKLLARIKKES